MPPIIAAIIFIVFIFIVFAIDFKRKPDVTFTHWIPFIWLLIISSRPLAAWIIASPATISGGMYEAAMEGSVLDSTVFSILLVLGFFILSKRIQKCKLILRNNLWLVFLILYCLMSIFWSDYPYISFKRWIRGAGTFIMILVVLTETNPLETIKTMLRRCAFSWIPLSILFIKYFRGLGVCYETWGAIGYCGVSTGKNPLGRLCLILGIYFFWEIFINLKNKNSTYVSKKESFINIIFLGMILWTLIIANSATATLCLLIAVSIILLFSFSPLKNNINNINTIFFILIGIALLLDLTLDLTNVIITSMDRDTTLTGRTEIWSLSLKYVENPLIGVGYDNFWHGERLLRFWNELGSTPIHAHNGYLDVYLQIGIIGLSLLIGVLFSIYKKITKTIVNDYNVGIFQLSFFIVFLLYNITENSFKLHHFFWFVFLLIELAKAQNEGPIIKVPSPATTST